MEILQNTLYVMTQGAYVHRDHLAIIVEVEKVRRLAVPIHNLQAVAAAAGGSLDDIVKLTLLLADLGDFAKVNDIMATRFKQPYPARATYQVAALPKAGRIEVEAVLVLQSA